MPVSTFTKSVHVFCGYIRRWLYTAVWGKPSESVIISSFSTKEDAIKQEDIKNAAEVSHFIYDDKACKQDVMVPNTQFKIIKTIHENLQEDGEGIRSVIADGPHNTRILAFRGTDG